METLDKIVSTLLDLLVFSLPIVYIALIIYSIIKKKDKTSILKMVAIFVSIFFILICCKIIMGLIIN